MGMFKLFSSASLKKDSGSIGFSNDDNVLTSKNDINFVDIYNYKTVATFVRGQWTLLKLNYPNCKNYDGDKIILLKGFKLAELEADKFDPHFLQGNKIFGRFEPTLEGWQAGMEFINYQISKK